MDDDHGGFHDEPGWIAIAGHPEPLTLPERARRRARTAGAGRALACALLGVLCFGIVLGPLALSMGYKARFAIADEPEMGGAGVADAAIALGKLGLALHLAIALTVLPWLLFALPLVGSLGG